MKNKLTKLNISIENWSEWQKMRLRKSSVTADKYLWENSICPPNREQNLCDIQKIGRLAKRCDRGHHHELGFRILLI